MSMDIYAKKGHRVIVSKQTAHNGYDTQKENVEKHLEIGKIYNIESTSVSQSSTSIVLKQFPDKNWNSVNFIDYVDAPKEDDFKELVPVYNQTEHMVLKLNKGAYEFAVRKWKRENEEQIEARAMYKERVVKLSDSEMIITDINAVGECNGCLRYKKDIMITYRKEGSETIYDLFLDKEQAIRLQDRLTKVLKND